MIHSIKVTNEKNESLLLSIKDPDSSGFFIYNIDGLGPPKATINLAEILLMDGGIFNSSRVTFRNIIITLGFNDNNIQVETLRQKIYNYFPLKGLINLEITTDNRVSTTVGYVESNDPTIFSKKESTTISIICPSSYLFSGLNVNYIMGLVVKKFKFPFQNPSLTEKLILFGNPLIPGQPRIYTINNPGDVKVGGLFYIDFTGPVNNLVITNEKTGQTMSILSSKIIELTGSDFNLGDRLIISTKYGEKYVSLFRSNIEINALHAFDFSGDWLEISRGLNPIKIDSSSGLNNILATVVFDILYEGV